MTVRSAVLARVHFFVTVPQTLYTCPAGITTIVKSIVWQNNANNNGTVAVWLSNAGNAIQPSLFHVDSTAGQFGSWDGWVILAPGDQLQAAVIAGTDVWVSGTKLEGVAP